jgi:hypothetical protein
MVSLDLDGADEAILRDLLANAIRDLSPEIADTDNPEYRRMLKQRRDRLVALLGQMGEPVASRTT